MAIQNKLGSNPELIQANRLVAEALDQLIDRRWGSVTIAFSAQNGKISTIKINEEKIYKMNPPPAFDN